LAQAEVVTVMNGASGEKIAVTINSLVIAGIGALALAAVVMAGCWAYRCIVGVWLAPVRRTAARVLLKTQREYEVTRSGLRCGNSVTGAIAEVLLDSEPGVFYASEEACPAYDYFITFEFDGGRQEFAVKEDLYASVHEGDEGLLVYKGDALKHFIPGATRVEEIAPPRPRS